MSLEYVELTLDLYDGQGNPVTQGTATLTPTQVLTDTTDHEITGLTPVTATFRPGTAPPVVKLLATDNSAPLPAGWAWTITPPPATGVAAFSFFLPHASGASQYLSAQIPVGSPSGLSQYLQSANNLSDVASPSTALANLGGVTETATDARYLRGQIDITTAGPPASGTWVKGQVSTDGNGVAWACTTGGTPGTWALAGSLESGTWYLDSFTGTDDQKMTSALSALFATSAFGLTGGTIQLSPRAHSFAGQWATTYTAGVATAVKIQGAGVAYNGQWGTPSAATTATFTYSGTGAAMMDFQHIGTIEITRIQFIQANTGKPFALVTNATPNIHDNVWSGGGSGTGCVTDAIILGGTGTTIGAGDTAPYQGYQGDIRRNFFDGIRAGVSCQSFCNGPVIERNTWSRTCGSNSSTVGAITINGISPNLSVGGMTGFNLIEASYYPHPVWMDYCINWTHVGNSFYDPTGTTLYYYYYNSANAYDNLVVGGFLSGSVPPVYDPDRLNGSLINNSVASQLASGTASKHDRGIITNGEYNGVPHLSLGDSAVESGNIPTFLTGTSSPNVLGNKSAVPGSVFINRGAATGAGAFFIKQATGDTQWFVPGSLMPVTTQTSSYPLAADDYFVIMNGSSLTATLLAPAAALAGKTWVIINKNSSSLTVSPASGLINGASSVSVAQYASARVMTDGSNYYTY